MVFHGIYPADDVERADGVLSEFHAIADMLGIHHFLWKGTCVGFISEGTYPYTDPDIDLGILCTKEQRERLFQALRDAGFAEERKLLLFNRHFIKDDITCDIFFLFPKKYLPFLQEFETIAHGGHQYHVPAPVEDYLVMEYGSEWRTPKLWLWKNGYDKSYYQHSQHF